MRGDFALSSSFVVCTVTVPDADIMIGSSRRSLSLVYSGKKRKGPSSIWKSLLVALPSADSPSWHFMSLVVSSLFQLSMRVLIDNIDGELLSVSYRYEWRS